MLIEIFAIADTIIDLQLTRACSASFSAASRAESTGTTGCMADADAEDASATGKGGGRAAGTRMLRTERKRDSERK